MWSCDEVKFRFNFDKWFVDYCDSVDARKKKENNDRLTALWSLVAVFIPRSITATAGNSSSQSIEGHQEARHRGLISLEDDDRARQTALYFIQGS